MNWTIYFIFCGSFGVHKYFFLLLKSYCVCEWLNQTKKNERNANGDDKDDDNVKKSKDFFITWKKRAELEVSSEVKRVLIQCWSTFFVSLLFIVHCLVDFSGCWITKSQPKFVATLSTLGKTHLFVCLFRHELITAKLNSISNFPIFL